MLKQKKSKLSGFTIIEVMIVLAIAGLILLIVFLAVPALQRSAHNTSAKNDVSSVLAGVNEYVNNNNGIVPKGEGSGIGLLGSNVGWIGNSESACAGNSPTDNCAQVKVGFYDPSNIDTYVVAPGANTPTPTSNSKVYIYYGAICLASGTAATTTGATARDYAAVYLLEGGAKECTAS
jgi:prepilin-type N-terminal cleavage/methylation domain-containing protein